LRIKVKGKIMLKVKLVVVSLGFAMMLPLVPALLAQAPAAPLPSQIATAKKVFISNAGREFLPNLWSGTPDRTYNEFYTAVKTWGRYDLVGAPGEADMVFEISFSNPITTVGGGASTNTPHFWLVLRDPKTHVVLWTLEEYVPTVGLQKARDKKFDDALNTLVDDLKALTAQSAATNSTK
jgi:hypothetical protein